MPDKRSAQKGAPKGTLAKTGHMRGLGFAKHQNWPI